MKFYKDIYIEMNRLWFILVKIKKVMNIIYLNSLQERIIDILNLHQIFIRVN